MQAQRDAIRRFLLGEARYVCAPCTAARLNLSVRQVTMITLGLARSGDFEAANDACGLCQDRRRVIRALGVQAPAGAEPDVSPPDKTPSLSHRQQALLFSYCSDHGVAWCTTCRRDYHLTELAARMPDRPNLCPSCGSDLTERLRAHLSACGVVADTLLHRARETATAAREKKTAARELRDSPRSPRGDRRATPGGSRAATAG